MSIVGHMGLIAGIGTRTIGRIMTQLGASMGNFEVRSGLRETGKKHGTGILSNIGESVVDGINDPLNLGNVNNAFGHSGHGTVPWAREEIASSAQDAIEAIISQRKLESLPDGAMDPANMRMGYRGAAAGGWEDAIVNKGAKAVADQQKALTKEAATRFADIVNSKIDALEGAVNAFLDAQSRKQLNQRYVDALQRPGVDVITGERLTPGTPYSDRGYGGRMAMKIRGNINNFTEALLFPSSGSQAFGLGMIRGGLGGAMSGFASDFLVNAPNAAIKVPQARAFYREMSKQVDYLRPTGKVITAPQMKTAFKRSKTAAQNIYGEYDTYSKQKAAGYITGRGLSAGAATYVFVPGEERRENFEKFKESLQPFIKKESEQFTRKYYNQKVKQYQRSDGTVVRSHNRTVQV